MPFSKLLKKGTHPREVLCFARLEGGNIQGGNYTALAPWKWVPVEKPEVEATLQEGKEGLELHVQSRNIVPFFHAELKGWEGHFAGDWEVLKPGEKQVLRWVPHFQPTSQKVSLAGAKKRLKTTTFYDLFK